MFMQAWGHYGTAWAAVHQQLGVRPHLGRDFLEVVPQVPDEVPSVQGADIRLGSGSADVFASHAGSTYTTKTDTSDAPVEDFRIGHTLPRGATVGSVLLDGAPAAYTTRVTNRGLEVWVPASAGRPAHAGRDGGLDPAEGRAHARPSGSSASAATTWPCCRREWRRP